MREENKQTKNQENSNIIFYYLKNFYNKRISNILLNSNTKKAVFIILISFIFTFLLIKGATAFDMDEVTYKEILVAKNNGLISSLCFVQNLLTGNLARAVGAVFILGCGWLFLIGSIKDWKPVLSLTVATTLIFGAAEFAEVISGNDFTCKTIYETEEKVKEEAIYNEGICKLIDIDIYTIGQKWYICNSNVTEFSTTNCEEITDATVINSDDKDVFLVTCQSGSYKPDEKVFLRYKCNKDKELFELQNENDREKGSCIKACTTTQLKEILTSYHAKSTLENNKFEILDDSGKLKNGAYYTAGTIINLDCLSSYTELNEKGIADNKGLTVICTSVDAMAEFKVIGSCRGSCNLNNLSDQYKNTFVEWQKYNKETDFWEDTQAREFYFEDKVRIKTCNSDDGYRFDITDDLSKTPSDIIPDGEKLVFKCGSGEHNKETWVADNNGKSCIRYCNIEDYEFYREHNWRKNCPSLGDNYKTHLEEKKDCSLAEDYQTPLEKKEDCFLVEDCKTPLEKNRLAFKVGEKIGISSCTDKNNYFLNTRGDADRVFLKITCGENGKWMENNGFKCQKKCKIENMPFYNYAKKWKVCLTVINEDGTIKECNNLEYNEIDNVIDGDTVQQISCQKGYGFNSDEGSTFICKEGNFKRESGDVDEICMPQCYFNLLGDFDNKSLQWQGSNEKGIISQAKKLIDLSTVEENEMSDIREYYALKNCIEGYEIVNIKNERNDDIDNKYTTILCNANKRWEVIKQELKCNIKKCTFNKETIKKDLESDIASKNDYEILGLAYVNSWDVFETDAEAKLSDISKEYTITDNSTAQRFNYGTEIKIKTCINNAGTYLLGEKDTMLKCNSDAKWQIESRSSVLNTKRCKIGICKGLPNLIEGSTISFNSARKGNHYLINGNLANFASNTNVSNINEVYSENGSLINATCTGAYKKIKFNDNCNNDSCKVNFGGSCADINGCIIDKELWDGHYYYCDNGSWKSKGSCIKSCYGEPTLVSQSTYYNNIDSIGKFYNSYGTEMSPNTSNINSLYAEIGSAINATCDTDYREVKFGGVCSYNDNCGGYRDSLNHYYYCDEDGEWKVSGSCLKSCYGNPVLTAGSYLYPSNNINKSGIFYNFNGVTIETLTENNLKTAYSTINSIVKGACKNNYTEVNFNGNCDNCDNRMTHYYYCNNKGEWKTKGSCILSCKNLPTDLIENSNNINDAIVNGTVFDLNKSYTVNGTAVKDLNNVYYGNNATLNGSCKSGYTQVGGEIKYTCSNGGWSKASGECKAGCNDISPIYDINGNKISNQLYGTTFANNGYNNAMHVYLLCYKNNDTSTVYNLNINKTGIGNMNPNEYIRCSFDLNNLKGYYTQPGRKLICKQNDNINNGNLYWQYQFKSCDLNELKNTYPSLDIKLAYGGIDGNYVKNINTIMTSGAKQLRFPAYHNSGYQIEWSKPYITNGIAIINCDQNGNWNISSIKVEYYSPQDSNKYTSKYFDKGAYVCCNNDTFGDIHLNVVKACKINGKKIVDENGCFTVNL